MSDFINSGLGKGVGQSGFNTQHQQGKPPSHDKNEAAPTEATRQDPYGSQRLSADDIFSLMNQHAQLNRFSTMEQSIAQSIGVFEQKVSPERHDKMIREVASVYQDEFGLPADKKTVELMVANHLIGNPHIQPSGFGA